jgi:hypothetical protein
VDATVERGSIRVLDRHGLHGESVAWLSEPVELVELVEIAPGGYSVLQYPTGAEPFAHVEGVSLEEAQEVYSALRPRRAGVLEVVPALSYSKRSVYGALTES